MQTGHTSLPRPGSVEEGTIENKEQQQSCTAHLVVKRWNSWRQVGTASGKLCQRSFCVRVRVFFFGGGRGGRKGTSFCCSYVPKQFGHSMNS